MLPPLPLNKLKNYHKKNNDAGQRPLDIQQVQVKRRDSDQKLIDQLQSQQFENYDLEQQVISNITTDEKEFLAEDKIGIGYSTIGTSPSREDDTDEILGLKFQQNEFTPYQQFKMNYQKQEQTVSNLSDSKYLEGEVNGPNNAQGGEIPLFLRQMQATPIQKKEQMIDIRQNLQSMKSQAIEEIEEEDINLRKIIKPNINNYQNSEAKKDISLNSQSIKSGKKKKKKKKKTNNKQIGDQFNEQQDQVDQIIIQDI
ncbi:UNKNOWN [Stylonychia lemnae]|uniref:Uncharacterized protein n=1 Tax=Stylonychia lemnae TaxID=5949 RepID=A0A078AKS5_STYLE|nr:UNKNOWN [Stylonychia lemnae]|eukprot:CDW82975.1 UNKNOWN [Stylonychia lemnae]